MSFNDVLQGACLYDFAGRQAIRTIASAGVAIHSVFDGQGRRIAEYNQATGALIREYVWMGWAEARPDGLPVEARQRRTPANAFAGSG